MAFRTLPPAGTAIRASELARWLLHSVRRTESMGVEALERKFERRFGVDHAVALSSARGLLTVALQELAERHPGRSEVVVPGYTCYSVAASVARAGLRVRPIDIDPTTLDYDREALDRLDPSPVLALVSASLFGVPDDLPGLERFAEERSIALIDDAAQAMGAEIGGRFAGTFGTAGIFSLDKGKNITSMRGGVLLTRDAGLATRIRARVATLEHASRRGSASDASRMAGYVIFLRPRLYWIVDRILDLGGTTFDPDFPLERYPRPLAPMAHMLLDRLDELGSGRRARADSIARRLPSQAMRRGEGVHLRVPVLMGGARSRDEALRLLDAHGLGASPYYPEALLDVPGVNPFLAPDVSDTPAAREVARRLLTLPTHSFVTDDDVERMGRLIEQVAPHKSRSS